MHIPIELPKKHKKKTQNQPIMQHGYPNPQQQQQVWSNLKPPINNLETVLIHGDEGIEKVS